MQAAPVIPGVPLERMTWAVMKERFPDRWVIVAEMDGGVDMPDFSARVLAVHEKQMDVTPHMDELFDGYQELGCFWTGKKRRLFFRGPLKIELL